MGVIAEMFQYTFMVRAILVGLLISVCAAILGVSMVLKRYSMIGDGLSHVGFAALAIASALNIAPLWVAIPVCILAAFLLMRLNANSKIKGDSAIAMICSGSLAVGVMIVSLVKGMNTDLNNYLFGSILSLSQGDMILSIVLSVIVIIVFVFFYPRIFAVTFDENFAKATGTKAGWYSTILAILTAVTVVIGMRMMGALLISSLIIFPALTSMRVCKNYKKVVIVSVIVSAVCFFIGITLSFVLSVPTGACIVCVDIITFGIFCLVQTIHQRSRLK